jgi:hypothetical protein
LFAVLLAHFFLLYLGKTLRTRLLAARKELARQEEGLEEFTAAQEAEAPAWKQMVDDFEAGVSEANPYLLPHTGIWGFVRARSLLTLCFLPRKAPHCETSSLS